MMSWFDSTQVEEAGLLGLVQAERDHVPEGLSVVISLQQVEIERLPQPVGQAYRARRSDGAFASATTTAVRGGEYSSKTFRHSA